MMAGMSDPDFSDLASLGKGFDDDLGIHFEEVTPDGVVLTLAVTPRLLQPNDIVHGGVWCTVVETAASVAGACWFREQGHVVGVSNHTDFLRATGPGTNVRARATPIHRGRRQQLWLVEIHDDAERLIARGQVRLQNLPHGG